MHTRLYHILFLFFIALSVSAQKNLVVYHTSGNINLIQSGKSTTAKRGDIITKDNSLQVGSAATCMIIAEKGRSLQVDKPGTYTFNVLHKMLATAGQTGGTQKLLNYIYESMFSNKNENQLSVTPVVFRGDELMKSPSDNTITIADAFAFGWRKPAGKIPVHLIVLNDKDEKVFDTVLKKTTSLQINVTKNNFLPGAVYKWRSEEADSRQPKEKYFYFLIADKKDRKQILKDIKLLQDKNLSKELKLQLQQDIFLKWKQFYSPGN